MPPNASLVRFLRPLSLAVAALALVYSTSSNAADEQSPEQALELYVDGLRGGSLEKLQRLFLAEGQFCAVSEEPERRVVCRKFSDVLGSWVARPDPRTSGRVVDHKVATPSMAAVTYELQFAGTRYVDQLLLYKIDGRWQVVAKTTTAQ